MSRQRYWIGKANQTCDMCNTPIGNRFTDGKTKRGPWAIMCDTCLPMWSIASHKFHGEGLGQEYTRQADGRYLKTKG